MEASLPAPQPLHQIITQTNQSHRASILNPNTTTMHTPLQSKHEPSNPSQPIPISPNNHAFNFHHFSISKTAITKSQQLENFRINNPLTITQQSISLSPPCHLRRAPVHLCSRPQAQSFTHSGCTSSSAASAFLSAAPTASSRQLSSAVNSAKNPCRRRLCNK
ncbi:hypothetical protein M0R45_027597 [Rubus argutus]|uniref:Uncharacterized protein n=1 Tax=Rubus argutus TaxID=59490 RepID=A0AAW1X0S5_RUBAR